MFDWIERIWNRIPFRNWEHVLEWYVRKFGAPDMLMIVLDNDDRHRIVGFIEVRDMEVDAKICEYRVRDISSESELRSPPTLGRLVEHLVGVCL